MKLHQKLLPQLTPIEKQRRVLAKLLSKAQWTEFGRAYDFEGIRHKADVIGAFRAAVPVFDYESMYEQWWHRSLKGEPNIAWPGDISYFALTSGTSIGSSKYVPVTKDMLKSIQKVGVKIMWSFAKKKYRHLLRHKIFILGGCSSLEQKNNLYVGDLSGINIKNTPFWFNKLYVPGKDISGISDWNERIEKMVDMAPQWDIGIITGIPSWVYLLLDKIIKRYDLESIHDIWPNLGAFVHGGIAFSPYRGTFDKLLRKPIIYVDTYLASEGFIAYQKEVEDQYMTLALKDNIFFEFIPFDSDHYDADGRLINDRDVLDVSEVEAGKEYALLLSNTAGAWRYQIGDVIRFEDVKKCQISIVGRTKLFLSICGEHLSIDNMTMAIEEVREKTGLDLTNFTVYAEKRGDYFFHKWFVGLKSGEEANDPATIRQIIDKTLMRLNDDYRTERGSVLKDPELVVLPETLFYEFLEHEGKLGGQHKFPNVLKGAIKDRWISFLASTNRTNKSV